MAAEITWHDMAAAHPHFVQWVAQTLGPLPDGPIREDDYNQFKAAYEDAHGRATADG